MTQSFVDELAAGVGMDPVDFRLKNALRAGELHPFSTAWNEGREPRPEIIHTVGKVSDLTEGEVNSIRHYVDENLTIEGDLRRDVQGDIKRKIEIGCLQGVRHRKGLPVRGQRTHTNARTRKGPRRMIKK